MKKVILCLAFLGIIITAKSQGFIISSAGAIDFSNGFSSLNEAGSDFPSPMESSANFNVSVGYNTSYWWDYYFYPNRPWKILVSKSDIDWDNQLELEVRRTGNGALSYGWSAGSLFVINGGSYQQISNSSSYFFEGRHGVANIPLSFRLTGASVTLGVRDFSTIVYLTVYDN